MHSNGLRLLPIYVSDTTLCSPQTTLPLLRLSMVLLRLSELIYSVDDKYLDSTVGVELPIAGRHGDRASVVAKLVHFR